MALAIAVTFLLLAASCGDGGDGKVPPALPPAPMPDPPPLPAIAAAECTIAPALWGIYTDGTHAKVASKIPGELPPVHARSRGRAVGPLQTLRQVPEIEIILGLGPSCDAGKLVPADLLQGCHARHDLDRAGGGLEQPELVRKG